MKMCIFDLFVDANEKGEKLRFFESKTNKIIDLEKIPNSNEKLYFVLFESNHLEQIIFNFYPQLKKLIIKICLKDSYYQIEMICEDYQIHLDWIKENHKRLSHLDKCTFLIKSYGDLI